MARSRRTLALSVCLNGRRVGTLNRATSGAVDFTYGADWLEWEHAFAISLSLPLRPERYVGEVVIAVFDNLLPDNDQIRRRLAECARAGATDAVSLLAAIGRDCVGALQFLPEGVEPDTAGHVNAEPLSSADIAVLLRNLEAAPLGVDVARDFRISLAGAQEKTALLFHDGSWHRPIGSSPTTHILKPQLGHRAGQDLSNSVENEFLCGELLAALGMPVARSEIIDFEDQRVLVVERFDRRWTADGRLLRLPQEDFCQALGYPPTLRYQADGGPGIDDAMELLKGADEPLEDQRRFFKAQMVHWLLGATDGHAKNFSIFLGPGPGFRLAPLYDVMSTQPLVDAGTLRRRDMKMSMAIGTSRHYAVGDIHLRHFEQTAASTGFSASVVAQLVAELTEELPRAIDSIAHAHAEGIPAALFESVANGAMRRLQRFIGGNEPA